MDFFLIGFSLLILMPFLDKLIFWWLEKAQIHKLFIYLKYL